MSDLMELTGTGLEGGRWWPVKEGLCGKLLRATSGALADLRMGTRHLNKTRRLNLVETMEGVHLPRGRESSSTAGCKEQEAKPSEMVVEDPRRT